MKREYAHEPPIVSVTQLNPEQCEVLLHENINAETRTTTGANGEEQTTVYTAQEYTLIIRGGRALRTASRPTSPHGPKWPASRSSKSCCLKS